MSELWGNLIGVLIVMMIVSFVGGWVWLWQKRHKPLFDEMAALPMSDTDLAEEQAR